MIDFELSVLEKKRLRLHEIRPVYLYLRKNGFKKAVIRKDLNITNWEEKQLIFGLKPAVSPEDVLSRYRKLARDIYYTHINTGISFEMIGKMYGVVPDFVSHLFYLYKNSVYEKLKIKSNL